MLRLAQAPELLLLPLLAKMLSTLVQVPRQPPGTLLHGLRSPGGTFVPTMAVP